jgi:hypothetical protein
MINMMQRPVYIIMGYHGVPPHFAIVFRLLDGFDPILMVKCPSVPQISIHSKVNPAISAGNVASTAILFELKTQFCSGKIDLCSFFNHAQSPILVG